MSKERVYFKDQEGRKLRKSEVNVHHLAFYSPDYDRGRDSLEHVYRHLPAMMIRMTIPLHDDLHKAIKRRTPKPHEHFMQEVVNYERGIPGNVPNYERLVRTLGFLEITSCTSPIDRDAHDAGSLLSHLRSQREFIDPGHVELWTPEQGRLFNG